MGEFFFFLSRGYDWKKNEWWWHNSKQCRVLSTATDSFFVSLFWPSNSSPTNLWFSSLSHLGLTILVQFHSNWPTSYSMAQVPWMSQQCLICYKSLYTFSACTYLATDWWKAVRTNNTGAERMQAWQLLLNNTPPYWNFECSNQIKIYTAEALTETLWVISPPFQIFLSCFKIAFQYIF